ncbi:MAG: ribulose-phosphate 3-epimerase [Gammaproteobacteria bacterium RIFCSPHIGHO2_12_FULL_41_20]|nr:MAG: ribulose-phosphate 3-epimerase [Gammaproteobacteria bacterium RIFCSPHIGHO2_12_FULL_41_20]
MHTHLIAPSLLSADFARLGEESKHVLEAGADLLHLDVMDNHYVPNLTVGPLVCKALRDYGINAAIDVHLMTNPVDRLITDFAQAGASNITIHPEASKHVDRSLDLIHSHHCRAGLAINPGTTLHYLEYLLDKIDILLIMSVNPGFGGQAFIPSVLAKIQKARQLIQASGRNIYLAVDGGINKENIKQVAQAGADFFVAGSAIFTQSDYKKAIADLRSELTHANT